MELTPKQIATANEFAAQFEKTYGEKMALFPSEWERFERAGLDMTLFRPVRPLPPAPLADDIEAMLTEVVRVFS